MYVSVNLCTYTFIYIYTNTYIVIYIHTYTLQYIYVYNIYIYISYVCMYMYTHTHTHTHTHSYIHANRSGVLAATVDCYTENKLSSTWEHHLGVPLHRKSEVLTLLPLLVQKDKC